MSSSTDFSLQAAREFLPHLPDLQRVLAEAYGDASLRPDRQALAGEIRRMNQVITAVIETCPIASPGPATEPEPASLDAIRLGKHMTIEQVDGKWSIFADGQLQRPLMPLEELLLAHMIVERKRAIELGIKNAPAKVRQFAEPEAALSF